MPARALGVRKRKPLHADSLAEVPSFGTTKNTLGLGLQAAGGGGGGPIRDGTALASPSVCNTRMALQARKLALL